MARRCVLFGEKSVSGRLYPYVADAINAYVSDDESTEFVICGAGGFAAMANLAAREAQRLFGCVEITHILAGDAIFDRPNDASDRIKYALERAEHVIMYVRDGDDGLDEIREYVRYLAAEGQLTADNLAERCDI